MMSQGRRLVRPADLADESRQMVAGGAFLAGGRADALIAVNHAEVDRRTQVGIGPVTNLALLDLFLSLPQGFPIAVPGLSEEQLRLLATAPAGAIAVEQDTVTRLLDRPVRVDAAVARVASPGRDGRRRGDSWRTCLRRAGRFVGVTAAVVVLPEWIRVPETKLWEADVIGVGVWQEAPGEITELVPPGPFVPARLQAAVWRFEERAFRAWREATGVDSLTNASPADSGQGTLW